MLKDCLPLQDTALQTPLHAAATKLITGNNADYYEECLEQMVAKAKEIPGKTAQILNARDQHGNTALHYLAQNELGFVALRAIVNAGGDITIRNNKKLTARDIAMNNGSTRVIKILSTADKNLRHSMRYDSSVYTTESPPESPLNDERDDGSQDVTSENADLEEYPMNNTNVETTEGTDNTEQADEDPSSHNTNGPLPGNNEDVESSQDVTSENEEESLAVNDTQNEPSGSVDEDISHVTNGPLSGDADDVPSGLTDEPPSGAADDASSGDEPSGTADNAFSGDEPPPGASDNASSGVTSHAPSDVIINSTCTMTPNTPSGVGINTSPSTAMDDNETESSVDVGGQFTPHSECRSGCVGVQTPALDQYSCIVHIKKEMLSQDLEPVSRKKIGSIFFLVKINIIV